MTHDATQPTLPARHEGSLEDRIRRLGLIEAIALSAFEAAKDEAAPIAPSLRLTLELAQRLHRHHIFRLLDVMPDATSWGQSRALYDPVAWEYLADPLEPGVLRLVVAQHLRTVVGAHSTAEPLWLWQRLSASELEGYVAHLLRRHQMDPSWVRPILERSKAELAGLSLAQRRAVAWAGVREGAAAFLRTRGDAGQCLEAILCETRRQARWMLRHDGALTSWMPQSSWRQPLLLSTFLACFPLGSQYWLELPSSDVLARIGA